MSSLPEIQALYSPSALLTLVRDFDREPVANRKRISDFLQYQPEIFYRTTVEILKRDTGSRAAQYLVALLISGNLLFRALCDPVLDRARATELARHAQRGDAQVDIRLARQLADAGGEDAGMAPGMAERLLEIIDDTSDGKRLLPSLMRLLRNDNPYLRSKAVLMIGRSGRSVSWLEKRLQEADTRVRANAIEGMWGIDSPEARQLLEWATQDANNRVVGNALLGQYCLSEISSLGGLIKMAVHESPAFRRTAAWVMGRTGDPRFSEVLGRMIADPNGNVRTVAFAAVGKIRASALQASQTLEWRVAAAAGPKNPRTGERRVSVGVNTDDGRGNPQISPIQFILAENGQTVWSYRVAEKMPPGPLAVAFLFPRIVDRNGAPWDHGALRCLSWKRSTDLWSAVPYFGDGDKQVERSADLELPAFIANASRVAESFQKTPSRRDCSGFWTAVRRSLQPGDAARHSQKHMIVLAPDELSDIPEDSLVTAAHASRMSIQVLSRTANPVLQEFCRRVGASFQCIREGSSIEDSVSLAYLSLLARYEVRYQSVAADASSLKIRVQSPKGWGETTIDL